MANIKVYINDIFFIEADSTTDYLVTSTGITVGVKDWTYSGDGTFNGFGFSAIASSPETNLAKNQTHKLSDLTTRRRLYLYSVASNETDRGSKRISVYNAVERIDEHSGNQENPHRVTALQTGAVPQRLSSFSDADANSSRLSTYLYADQNNTSTRISLQSIKNLSTKIETVSEGTEIDFSKLNQDDYIFINNN